MSLLQDIKNSEYFPIALIFLGMWIFVTGYAYMEYSKYQVHGMSEYFPFCDPRGFAEDSPFSEVNETALDQAYCMGYERNKNGQENSNATIQENNTNASMKLKPNPEFDCFTKNPYGSQYFGDKYSRCVLS